MKNIELAHKVIQELVNAGVEEFCLCAGARNSPFIYLFDANPHLKAFHFFEERSAAFFALGKIAATRKPVAIITTSGTAAAELLPAAVEGTYSSLPLILITADRPRFYRKSGAPQAIDQVGLFSYYIEVAYDLDEENTHFSIKGLSWKMPIHVNICFKEPLFDAEIPQVIAPENPRRTKFPEAIPRNIIDDLETFLSLHRPVVLVGTLPEKHQKIVKEFLKNLKVPVYAEGISNLRGDPEIEPYEIRGGQKSLNKLLDLGQCDAVLRLGGVPTVRLWRDLEDQRKNLKVFSIGYNHFPGLSREMVHFSDLEVIGQVHFEEKKNDIEAIIKTDREFQSRHIKLFQKYPRSEPGLIYWLSKKLKSQSVYLGNSLPIREWDLASDPQNSPSRVVGNRGANGIDGQVSTFLGWMNAKTENWCLLGDLTALYDLSAPWILPQLLQTNPDLLVRFVVINNSGGQIFKKMFKKEIFLNQHNLSFEGWAAMWNLGYQQWMEVPDQLKLHPQSVIEIR
ncbi:MAG: 2-succinyl-5-enolpyruvyl-6-hydroxy-3-cyclohexene-1-carboxylic-acid synthase, partial [Pseudobdellovibrionaceae bacterium]